MKATRRAWVGRGVVAVLAAVVANAVLSGLAIRHDAALVALLAAATVAAVLLTLTALDVNTQTGWTVHRGPARLETGEDTRTAMYRHVVDVHLTSLDADDTIVWQIADLGRHRVRQLHGRWYDESPEQLADVLGPQLADWVTRDRRHRYEPDTRHQRYTVRQLGEVVRRIEEL